MGNESFKNLYPVIAALTDEGKDFLSKAADKLCNGIQTLSDDNIKALRDEAGKLLAMMNNYVEPVLPFADVTDEQIQKAFDDFEKSYGFPVWSNEMAGTDEDCARRVKDEPEFYLGMKEDEVRRICYEACAEDRDILKNEFDQIKVNGILITGTLGRWNGPKPVFAVKKNLKDVFCVFTGDRCTLYIEGGHLKAQNVHHDGTDRFTIYTFKEGVDPDDFTYLDQINNRADTESLIPTLNKHFGWKLCSDEQESLIETLSLQIGLILEIALADVEATIPNVERDNAIEEGTDPRCLAIIYGDDLNYIQETVRKVVLSENLLENPTTDDAVKDRVVKPIMDIFRELEDKAEYTKCKLTEDDFEEFDRKIREAFVRKNLFWDL